MDINKHSRAPQALAQTRVSKNCKLSGYVYFRKSRSGRTDKIFCDGKIWGSRSLSSPDHWFSLNMSEEISRLKIATLSRSVTYFLNV